MSNENQDLYKFGNFVLNPPLRRLSRVSDGRIVDLDQTESDLLSVLLEESWIKPDSYIPKSVLMDRVFGKQANVTESTLFSYIGRIRDAIGGDRRAYIKNAPLLGYLVVPPVQKISDLAEARPGVKDNEESELKATNAKKDTSVDNANVLLERDSSGRAWSASLQEALRVVVHGKLVWIIPAILTTLTAVLWALAFKQPHSTGTAAVLPFIVSGGNVEDKDLGMATTDAIITRLGLAGIPVRPLSAVQRYIDAKDDPQTFARKLGADFVVDGLIQHENERIRVTVHLTKVDDGAPLWVPPFDAKRAEIFSLQDRISTQIAQAMAPKLTARQNQVLSKHSTENDEAYLAYERGRYLWNKRTIPALVKAEEYFHQAIALDPGYASAYSGLADSYSMEGLYGGGAPKDLFPKAREAAQKALELDDNLAEAHASLGLIYLYYEWNGPEAEAEFKRSLEINPNYSYVHMWQGLNFTAMGRFSEAAKELERAQELDPLSPVINSSSGLPLCYQGEYARAIERFKKGLELDPNFARADYYLSIAYEQQGLYKQAAAELEKAQRSSGGNSEYEGLLGHAYAMAGDAAHAHKILEDLIQRSKKEYVPAFGVALIYLALGERDHSFEWLDKAYEGRSNGLIFLKVDPKLDSLRSDPRFKRLEMQVKFSHAPSS